MATTATGHSAVGAVALADPGLAILTRVRWDSTKVVVVVVTRGHGARASVRTGSLHAMVDRSCILVSFVLFIYVKYTVYSLTHCRCLARALYVYQAAIPEELGFAKGDILAVLRHQDDGWWEATVHGNNGNGLVGLVPSNYLQPI